MKKLLIVLVVCLVLAAFVAPRKCEPMGVNFDNTAGQQVKWGDASPLEGLTKFSYNLWVYKDAYYAVAVSKMIELGNIAAIGTLSNERFTLLANDTGVLHGIAFYRNWSGALGIWQTSTNPFTTGALAMITVTYDGSSAANVPVIYYNGVSQAVSTTASPSGTLSLTGADGFSIGALTATVGVDEKVYAVTAYNRILSQQEITDAYSTRQAIPTRSGLVFAPQLCSNGQLGEGGILAAGNTIADSVSGMLGTPAGSPLYIGDNFLTYP
jgi:hypothetical protein